MPDIILANSINFYAKGLKAIDRSFHIETPVEWAEGNRIMPVGGTNYPGPIDMDILPHHREIMDNMHPDSPVKRVSVMKSVQAGLTTSIESVVGWAIRYKLHNILMLISSKNIGKIRGSAAIDTMIDNSGLAEFIKPMSNRTDRKSGDSVLAKEFGSHRLMITSYKSMADLKSLSWDLIVMDELTEAPHGDMKDQGDVEEIIHGRTRAMRNAKIVKFSTPESINNCRIYRNYMQGDRRIWYIPCPICGERQELKLKAQGREYGLMAKYDENEDGECIVIDDSVRYVCKFCKKDFYEYQKSDFMLKGEWVPTAKAIDPNYRSYHMSGLMSPMIFYPWRDILSEFAATKFGQDIIRFKPFVNNAIGWVWENRSKKKSWEMLKAKKLNYEPGTVPPGGLVVTGGVDVQKSFLALHLVAWGEGMESWSFDYKIFNGDTSILDSQVWAALNDYVMQPVHICGQEMYISKMAIDTGHNPSERRAKDFGQKAHIVYDFVAQNPLYIAIRGHDNENQMLFKKARVYGSLLKERYDVSVSLIKEDIISHIDIDDGAGALHFVGYSDEFFKQFLSEVYAEVDKGKWGWKKIYDRNEAWDTWIYARAAAQFINLPSWSASAWQEYENGIKIP